jgi:hypothetical protein
MTELLPAGPGWEFLPALRDGGDIIARAVAATRFGGSDDSQDNGIGASGFNIRAHPEYLGVSLPQRGRGIKTMRDCPIPRLPWFIPVKVFSNESGKVAYAHLIDIGPSKATGHAIDLSNAVVEALGLSLSKGVYTVSFRVIGAAKYLPASS